MFVLFESVSTTVVLNSLFMYTYGPCKKKRTILIMQEGKILENSHSTLTIINATNPWPDLEHPPVILAQEDLEI